MIHVYKLKVKHGELQDDQKRAVVLRRMKRTGCVNHLDDTETLVLWLPHQRMQPDAETWLDVVGVKVLERKDVCSMFE